MRIRAASAEAAFGVSIRGRLVHLWVICSACAEPCPHSRHKEVAVHIRQVIHLARGVRSRCLRYGAIGVVPALSCRPDRGQRMGRARRPYRSAACRAAGPANPSVMGDRAVHPLQRKPNPDPADRAELSDVVGVAANPQRRCRGTRRRIPHALPFTGARHKTTTPRSGEHQAPTACSSPRSRPGA